ncbi:DnaJ protein ERDJ3A [Dictyocoela muelleri]|nr:DnaJ protein ERDJ3A [Dictyocoela muelleri]
MIPKHLSINYQNKDELRNEFLKKVVILHPDKNKDKSSVKNFCELMNEYELLKNGLENPHFYGKYKSNEKIICRCGDEYVIGNFNLDNKFIECNSCSCFIEIENINK